MAGQWNIEIGRKTTRDDNASAFGGAKYGGIEPAHASGNLAHKTADNHIQNLYKKIGATSRTAAAMYAVEHGIYSA